MESSGKSLSTGPIDWTEDPALEERDTAQAAGDTAESLVVPPSATGDKRSRSASPARITGPLVTRIFRQEERQEMLSEFAISIAQVEDRNVTRTAVLHWEKRVNELYGEAKEADEFIVSHWPTTNLNHPYFRAKVFRDLTNTRNNCLLAIEHLRQKHHLGTAQTESAHGDSAQLVKLPRIDLPRFTGAHEDWANFSSLFSSLVLDQKELKEVHKLQYLKTSVAGEPARLIAGFPLQEGHLEGAWETLVARYEDKGRLIASYLDRVLDLKPCTSSSSLGELKKVHGVISEAAKTVGTLAGEKDVADIIWAHLLSRNLHEKLREELEFALGRTREPPTFAEVDAYVNDKLRAMEKAGASKDAAQKRSIPPSTSAPSASKGAAPRGTAHQVSAQRTGTSYQGYSCDCCQGSHYIAGCSAFGRKTAEERRAFVVGKRLCFNCLGRHSARACKSTQGCKVCNGKHHSLLHETSPQAHAVTGASTSQGPSSSAQ